MAAGAQATWPKPPYPPKDRDGMRLRKGDTVRIVGLPPLPYPEDDDMGTPEVFRRILGTYRKIADVEESGLIHLEIRILKGRRAGSHSVWIEPFLLKKRSSKK